MIEANNLFLGDKMRRAFIASIATATPPFSIDQAQSGEYLLKHYADKLSPRSLSLTRKLFSHPSISIPASGCFITKL